MLHFSLRTRLRENLNLEYKAFPHNTIRKTSFERKFPFESITINCSVCSNAWTNGEYVWPFKSPFEGFFQVLCILVGLL